MASYVRGTGTLRVGGELSSEDLEDLISEANWLLGSGPAELTLDLDAVDPIDSSFLGAVAQLGSDARSKSKTLIVRASGRTADMLSWAGLHRVVALHISPAPVGA